MQDTAKGTVMIQVYPPPPIRGQRARFRAKVDEFVLEILRVNLRIVLDGCGCPLLAVVQDTAKGTVMIQVRVSKADSSHRFGGGRPVPARKWTDLYQNPQRVNSRIVRQPADAAFRGPPCGRAGHHQGHRQDPSPPSLSKRLLHLTDLGDSGPFPRVRGQMCTRIPSVSTSK